MSAFIRMQPVIEAFGYEGDFLCPWEIPEFNSFSMIRLGGEMTYPQIGLVFAQLATFNKIGIVADKQVVISTWTKLKLTVRLGNGEWGMGNG